MPAQDKSFHDGLPALFGGSNRFFPAYTRNLMRCLAHYLGTAAAPAPFVGRENALEELEAWRTGRSIPRLLLTAPPGYGVSTLLAHWATRLVGQPEVAVAYLPLSARFGTHPDTLFWPALAARLAELTQQPLPVHFTRLSLPAWRALALDLLQREPPQHQQLVLILDGLDEASWLADANPLPAELPFWVRVVAGAPGAAGEDAANRSLFRFLQGDGLQEVAVQHLLPLTAAEIALLASRSGRAVPPAALAEIRRLSGGAPLLVAWYLRALAPQDAAAPHLRPEDLALLDPGLAGYLQRRREDRRRAWGAAAPARERRTQTLLTLLAVAEGPLLAADIATLARDDFADGAEVRTLAGELDELIAGDGDELGFAPAHPALRARWRRGLAAPSAVEWQQRLAAWGRAFVTDEDDAAGADLPAYAVTQFRRHLELSAAPLPHFLPLLTRRWSEAWQRQTGLQCGYLRDAARVGRRVASANDQAVGLAPYLPQELLCALIQAAAGLREAEPVAAETLRRHIGRGLWTTAQTLVFAQQQPPQLMAETVAALLPTLPEDQQRVFARQILSTVQALPDLERRARLLIILLGYVPEEERPAVVRQALTALFAIEPPPLGAAENFGRGTSIEMEQDRQANALRRLRGELLTALIPHDPRQVLQAVAAQPDAAEFLDVLVALAARLPQEVWRVSRTLLADGGCRLLLARVLAHAPGAQQGEILAEALAAVKELPVDQAQVALFAELAPYAPEPILAAAQEIPDGPLRARALRAVAPHLPAAALAAARGLTHEGEWASVLRVLAPFLPETVEAERRKLEVARHREWVREGLIPVMTPGQQQAYLNELLATAQRWNDPSRQGQSRPSTSWLLTLKLLARRNYEQVLATVREIPDESVRADALANLIAVQPQGLLPEIERLKDHRTRTWLLHLLRTRLAPEERAELPAVRQRSIPYETEWVKLLCQWAPHVPDVVLALVADLDQRGHAFFVLLALAPLRPDAVLAARREVSIVAQRVELLQVLAPHRPVDVLAATREFADESDRVSLLRTLAPHAPTAVLEAARELLTLRRRVEAQSAAAAQLPPDLRAGVLREVLAALPAIVAEENQISALIDTLTDATAAERELLQERYKDVLPQGARDDALRRILVDLAPYEPRAALASAEQLTAPAQRAGMIRALAPLLPPEARPDAVDLVDERVRPEDHPRRYREFDEIREAPQKDWYRSQVAAATPPELPVERRAVFLQEALAKARGHEHGQQRIPALQVLVPHLAPDQQYSVMRELLQEMKADSPFGPGLLPPLAGTLAQLPELAQRALWRDFLQQAATCSRMAAVRELRAFTALLHHWGGSAALRGILDVIVQVEWWWP